MSIEIGLDLLSVNAFGLEYKALGDFSRKGYETDSSGVEGPLGSLEDNGRCVFLLNAHTSFKDISTYASCQGLGGHGLKGQ